MTAAAVLRQKGADVISVAPQARVAEAAEIIARRRIGAALMAMPVAALMTREVHVVTPACTVDEARAIMDSGCFRHPPVVDAQGRLAGIVSLRDLVRHRITSQERDGESLTAYVMGRCYALGRV